MSNKKNQKNNLITQQNKFTNSIKDESHSVELITNPITDKPSPQYKILSEKNSYHTLQNEVEYHLAQGWALQGGVSVAMYSSPYETVTVFSQSLTKNI